MCNVTSVPANTTNTTVNNSANDIHMIPTPTQANTTMNANNCTNPNNPVVISYPGLNEDDDFTMDSSGGSNTGSGYVDSAFQCIRFQAFQQQNWCTLYDDAYKEL